MSEYSWLFWILIVFLFAESWARAWAAHRGSRLGNPHEPTPCDPCP